MKDIKHHVYSLSANSNSNNILKGIRQKGFKIRFLKIFQHLLHQSKQFIIISFGFGHGFSL